LPHPVQRLATTGIHLYIVSLRHELVLSNVSVSIYAIQS
jgi:short-subunit dehydrogenase involved in D-alanine esterification of teichoic acids